MQSSFMGQSLAPTRTAQVSLLGVAGRQRNVLVEARKGLNLSLLERQPR